MSLGEHPFHGPIHHLAYLVHDLEAAVEHLVSKFAAGPFFALRDVAFEHVTSRGEPATFAHDSAFGQCGAVPIEVIQVKRLEPELVRAGFALRPPQLHHAAGHRGRPAGPDRVQNDQLTGDPRALRAPAIARQGKLIRPLNG